MAAAALSRRKWVCRWVTSAVTIDDDRDHLYRIRRFSVLLRTIVDTYGGVNYSSHIIEVRQTPTFKVWFEKLADRRAIERIAQRLVRLEAGLLGDVKSIGGGVSELRVDYGPGYRVYFTQRGKLIVILLCGGDKGTQVRDIKTAKSLAASLKEEGNGNRNPAV